MATKASRTGASTRASPATWPTRVRTASSPSAWLIQVARAFSAISVRVRALGDASSPQGWGGKGCSSRTGRAGRSTTACMRARACAWVAAASS